MKLSKLLLLSVFMLIFAACSDSNENTDQPQTPENTEAEVQIEEIINVLNGNEDLSAFTKTLQAVNAKELTAKEFTLLAYKNTQDVKVLTKEGSTTSASDANIYRHMVAGKYTLDQLKKLDKLVALSKDTLYIVDCDSLLTINGVKMREPIVSDKSIIFVMDSIIPIAEKNTEIEEVKYEFTVYNINTNWTTENNKVYESVAAGVDVEIYKTLGDTVSLVRTIKADAQGKVTFSYDAEVDLFCEIVSGKSRNTFRKFVVDGLFTTQEEVNNYPVNQVFNNVVGGLILVDIDGDGKITDYDKVSFEPLYPETKDVYLIPESFDPNKEVEQEITWDSIYEAYGKSQFYFTSIDKDFSTKAQRQSLNINTALIYSYWDKAYEAINLINGMLQKESISMELIEMRATLYFQLTTLFGKIPLQITYPLNNEMMQSEQKVVFEFVNAEFDYVLSHVPIDSAKVNLLIEKAIISRSQHKYEEALNSVEEALRMNTLKNVNSEIGKRMYLLAAEMTLEINNLSQSIQYINTLYNILGLPMIAPSTTMKDVEALLKKDLTAVNSGMIFLNTKNWEDLEFDWGHYSLLPMPAVAIEDSKGTIQQNAGW